MVDLSSIHGELVRGTSCHWLIVSFGRVMFLIIFVHCQKKASNNFFLPQRLQERGSAYYCYYKPLNEAINTCMFKYDVHYNRYLCSYFSTFAKKAPVVINPQRCIYLGLPVALARLVPSE